jgi:hypothetical protein
MSIGAERFLRNQKMDGNRHKIRWEEGHDHYLIIVSDYDKETKEIVVEDVVDPDSGEVFTEEWFETEKIHDKEIVDAIEDEILDSDLDNQLDNILGNL